MNQNDLRVIRTKKLLSEALFDLLETYMMSSITISMICHKALVHRTTFYKHFYDKYDLLIYLFKSFSKEYFNLDIKDRLNSPFESISYIINPRINNIRKKQNEDPYFKEFLENHFVDVLKSDIKENVHRFFLDLKVPNDLIIYIYGANLNAIMEWTREKEIEMDPKELDQIFHRIIKLKIE